MMSDKTYSKHIFLFPFNWTYLSPDPNDALDKRISVQQFETELLEKHPSKAWKRCGFELQKSTDYNEYVYFYDFAREIMYDFGKDENLKSPNVNNEDLIRHYEYQISDKKGATYIIQSTDKDKYTLQLTDILLNVYSTGVGILSFHLINKDYQNPNDILKINEFGRRFFPPYLDSKGSIADAQGKLLANKITLRIDGKEYESDFKHYHKENSDEDDKLPDKVKRDPLVLPSHIREVLGGKEVNGHINPITEKEKPDANQQKKFWIYPALDDRMFVICCYANTSIANALATFPASEERHAVIEKGMLSTQGKFIYAPELEYGYVKQPSENADFWYKFLFIDTIYKTCQNEILQEQLVLKHTYDRWIGYKSLYGISRYSFVGLTREFKDDREGYEFLFTHIPGIYYKMVELVLVQRASVLRFAKEAARISHFKEGEDAAVIKSIRDLYQHFIRFRNKINFRRITAQEQGIELYDMMRELMQVEQEIKELDQEIDELHQYVIILEQKEQTEKSIELAENAQTQAIKANELANTANRLTKLAAYFLPATLLAGILGMNTMPDPENIPTYLFGGHFFVAFWISLGLIGLTLIVGWWISTMFTQNPQNHEQ